MNEKISKYIMDWFPRYPDDYIEFLHKDAEKALTAAIRIKEFVLSKVSPRGKTDGFGLVGILIVVAVITAFVGGGLYFRELKQQQSLQQIGREAEKRAEDVRAKIEAQQKELQEQMNQATPPPANAKTIDTSNWKTYRNEKYGFEVTYSSIWETKETSTSVVFLESEKEIMSMSRESADSAFNLTCIEGEDTRCDTLKTESKLTAIIQFGIAGNIDAEIKKSDGTLIDFHQACLSPKEDKFGHHCSQSSEEVNVFKKVLSTFKFIK